MPWLQLLKYMGWLWLQMPWRSFVYPRAWYMYKWVHVFSVFQMYQAKGKNKSFLVFMYLHVTWFWTFDLAGKKAVTSGSVYIVVLMILLGLTAAGIGAYVVYKYRLRVSRDLQFRRLYVFPNFSNLVETFCTTVIHGLGNKSYHGTIHASWQSEWSSSSRRRGFIASGEG